MQFLKARRGWFPWLTAWLFLLVVSLGVAPLSEREGALVAGAAETDWLRAGSPAFVLLLRLVATLGPPAEVVLRLAVLGALVVGGLLGGRLCRDLGSSPRAGGLASVCLLGHGALVLAAERLGPALLVWVVEAIVLVLALSTCRAERPGWRLVALAAAGVVLVLLEPASVALLLVVAGWCAWAPSGRGAAVAVLAPALVGLVLAVIAHWSSFTSGFSVPVPDLRALADAAVGLGPFDEGRAAAPHPFVVAAAPAVLAVLVGLALTGWVRASRDARILSIGLALPALVLVLLGRGEPSGSAAGALLLPPLLLLGAARTDTLLPGADRILWTGFLVGLSGLTGVGVITSSDRVETRAVAAALPLDARVTVSDPRLGAAIDFYRRRATRSGSKVRVWRPGDETPRLGAVHAFGAPVGRLWIVRPGAPLFDLMARLEDARVSYRERGRVLACPWQAARERFFCGGPEYQAVLRTRTEFDGASADAVYFPPLDDGVLEMRWDQVLLGRRFVGVAGLNDRSFEFSTTPVVIEVRVGSVPPVTLERGARRGLIPFVIDTSDGPERGPVVMRVSTSDDRGRHVFVDGMTVP